MLYEVLLKYRLEVYKILSQHIKVHIDHIKVHIDQSIRISSDLSLQYWATKSIWFCLTS